MNEKWCSVSTLRRSNLSLNLGPQSVQQMANKSSMDFRDIQDKDEMQQGKTADSGLLKLDQHGLPLLPQPTKYEDDPLVRAYST